MLSVVVVTSNSAGCVVDCLLSLKAQVDQDCEVFVVDNASCDPTKEIVRKVFPKALLIENTVNMGASFARNQAIARAEGSWVLTLDSDVVLDQDFIRLFKAKLDVLPDDVGMLQPDLLSQDGQEIYSQGIVLSPMRRFFDLNRGKPAQSALRSWNIIGPCAAAAFYRRAMLEELKEATGYFDERFFFLVEDVDLAWRASKKGWRTVFVPALRAFHQGDGSKTPSRQRRFLCWRNRHWMMAKNDPLLYRMGVYVFAAPYEVLRILLVCAEFIWPKRR